MIIHDTKDKIEAKNAGLAGSVFDDVNLSGSRFTNVNLSGTVFDNVNLTDVEFWNIDTHEVTIEGVRLEDLFAAYEARK